MLNKGLIDTFYALIMNIRQLHSFIAVAETLHFGMAAEQLNMTQPPLSRQIAALEDDIGTALFERHSRSVVLTPAGESFYHNIKKLLGELDFAVTSARAAARGEQGQLTVAFTMFAAWGVVPSVVSAFSKRYPQVALKLNETLPPDLPEALRTGKADVGITLPLSYRHELESQLLYREPLCAVVPDKHHLAERKEISVAELAKERFITFPESTAPALHSAVMQCCRQEEFEPQVLVETHLQQTIVNLVAEGLGVALVPASMSRMQLAGARFLALTKTTYIELYAYWHPQSANPCLAGLLDSLAVFREK